MPILWVFETDVLVVQKGLFPIENVENRFFTIYFNDLYHGNTGWLQGVPRGDKALQGVTKDYRNLFVTRTFPDTFSWSIVHKNQS